MPATPPTTKVFRSCLALTIMYELPTLFKQQQQQDLSLQEARKQQHQLELPKLPHTCSDVSLLEDHESDECDRILSITNDFKMQLLTVSLQPLHHSKLQPVYPVGQEHCSGS